MIVVGIDPGTEKSGVVVYDTDDHCVLYSRENSSNCEVLEKLRNNTGKVFCETIEPMGMPIGKTTIETAIWVGRYQEAVERAPAGRFHRVNRSDEKIYFCGSSTFKDPETGRRRSVTDAQIRAAIIDKYPATGGGKTPQVGTKKEPGPLYGVKGHAWSALAVVLTGIHIREAR